MMMELTFDATAGSLRTPAPAARERAVRHAHVPRASVPQRPADDVPDFDHRDGPAHGWHAARRPLRRIEEAFAVVVLVSLLALGTLTFGQAFEGLATAHAAGVAATAVSK